MEIEGGNENKTEAEEDEGNEPYEVHINEKGRKIHYKVPDDNLLPNWCAVANKECKVEPDIGTFDIEIDTDCLHKCRELSCMTIHHLNGVCKLSTKECNYDTLTDVEGEIYYGRLREPQDEQPQPECHEGLHPVGLDIFWPTNNYCKAVGIECPGEDMLEPRFRPTARQCMVECNAHSSCMTAHYREKICYLRESRCKPGEAEARPGGIDFQRLKMKGQKCQEGSSFYEEEQVSYTAKFCVAFGKTCKGHDVYKHPQHIAPFQECLKKCAKIRTCGSVDFFANQCSPKDYRCTDSELEDDPNVQNFMRLQEGEDCPGNRKPPSEEAPWSARFCLKRGWDCEKHNMAEPALPAKDFVECLTKCVSATNCEGAQFLNGQCQLKAQQCTPDERIEKEGGQLYYRLREGEECTEESSPPDCGEKASFMTERTSCPITCDHQVPEPCDTIKEPSCVCDVGYVRNEEGKCVPLSDCGCREHDNTKRKIGEVWMSKDCDTESRCELNDADQPTIAEEPKECPALEQCNGDGSCECVTGYTRDQNQDNTCQPDLECGLHSTYHPAGNACPDTCDKPALEAECAEPNKPTCLCNHGYILKEDDGKCVPYRECGCLDDAQLRVRDSSWWIASTCEKIKICQASYDELPKVNEFDYNCPEFSHCQADEKQRGWCSCDDGYTAHFDGSCKPGVECEAPTIFAPKTKACPSSCRAPDLASSCEATEGAGCICAEGSVLNEKEQCIPVGECPCYDEEGREKAIGDTWMSNDCSAYLTCTAQEGDVPKAVEKEHSCQENAVCDLTSGFPQCVCNKDFTPAVDGYTCVPDEPPCEDTITTRINTFIKDIMNILGGGCGSCSDTCRRPKASETCSAGSKICKCALEKYLYDETLGKCIPANECGCYDEEGNNRIAGTTWLNLECSKQQTCVADGEGAPQVKEILYSCFNCDGRGNCLD